MKAEYIRLIPLFPALGAFICGVLGYSIQKRFGKKPIHYIACGSVILSFLVSLFGVIQLSGFSQPGTPYLIDVLWVDYLNIKPLVVQFALRIDPLSAVMTLVVTFVGSLIHIFSTGYMDKETSYWRYFSFLNLFMFSMLILVLGENFILLFIGWEGVGLCSYLLIGFWFSDIEKAKAGMKAFIVNRIGDFAFIIGFLSLFWGLAEFFTSQNLSLLSFSDLQKTIESLGPDFKPTIWGLDLFTFVAICLFVGACGKSAQIPLYVWLPDAMAGPTPVSALIHAATMVTAGVYMVARLNFLYVRSPVAMTVVACVGALTALFAATIGIFQHDIKKVLAYSTVSQLGYMFIGVGVGAYAAGIFHLMTHAFFKGCLFLCAGSIIHALHHEQDMRNMGGLRKYLPSTYKTMLLATLAIAGIPPFAGFFSKDEILWKAFSNTDTLVPGYILWGIGLVAAGMTAFYMFRLVFLTFFGQLRAEAHVVKALHESPRNMTLVLWILAICSTLAGFIGFPEMTRALFQASGESAPVATLSSLKSLSDAAPLLAGQKTPGALEKVLFAFEHYTEPVFFKSAQIIEKRRTRPQPGHGTELLFMLLSVGVAVSGLYLARRLYLKDAEFKRVKSLQEKFPRLYLLVYNKYYVDEIYAALIIAPLMRLKDALATFDRIIIDGLVNLHGYFLRLLSYTTGLFDNSVIDGGVNLTADTVLYSSSRVRFLQSGVIQKYAIALVFSVLVLLAIFLGI